MKYRILITLSALFLLAACNNISQVANTLLGTSQIEPSFYTIDISKDNTVVSAKGTVINIPAGAIKSTSDKVKLKVLEALSIDDIVKAGLTTTANGAPLSSGGMIYIDAEGDASIVKPIRVSLPTDYYRKGMELYKGTDEGNGNINWDDAEPLNDTPLTVLDKGKQLFERNCSSCHDQLVDATGPDLAYAAVARDREWLHSFTRNPNVLIGKHDPQADVSYRMWCNTAMAAYPGLTDEELDMLFGYLRNVAAENGITKEPRDCYDSCMLHAKYVELMRDKYELLKGNQLPEPIKYIPDNSPWMTVSNVVLADTLVKVDQGQVGYYSFNINAFGWYNVDILLKGLPGFKDSRLTVRLVGQFDMQLHIYLVIPNEKAFIAGGLLNGSEDTYGFYERNGNIPLPQGKQAYILAMGEQGGNIVFGKTAFITSVSQELEVSLSPVSEQQFDSSMAMFNKDGVDISVQDSENAAALREVDSLMKEYRKYYPYLPVNCNCDCNTGSDTASFILEK